MGKRTKIMRLLNQDKFNGTLFLKLLKKSTIKKEQGIKIKNI